MRLLTVVFVEPKEFLAHWSPSEPNGALFCPTRASDRVLEEPLLIDVSLTASRHRTLLRGRVMSLVEGAGAWVHIDPRDRDKARFFVSLAEGDVEARLERSHIRFPAALPVACQIEELEEASDEARPGRIDDLGAGGAFVAAEEPPAVGTRVSLTFGATPSGGENLTVDGRVAWVQAQGERTGFGVRFDHRGVHNTARLRTLLRRAAETGRVSFAAGDRS